MAISGPYTDEYGRNWPVAYCRVSLSGLEKSGIEQRGSAVAKIYANAEACHTDRFSLAVVRVPFTHVLGNEILTEAYTAVKAHETFTGWTDC